MKAFISVLILLVAGPVALFAKDPTARSENPVLVLIFDGLRPEYISPERMPNLHALGEKGVVAERHHAVYPTVTRVNAASLSTGATPGTHGMLHNTIYLPEVSEQAFSSADLEMLQRAGKRTGDRLLTAATLGETLEAAGKRLWAAGSSGNGTTYLLNHRLSGYGAASARGFLAPQSSGRRILGIMEELAPADAEPPYRQRNRWAFEALLKVGLDEFQPQAAFLWITDPDFTTHREGVGAPLTLEAVRHVDEELGRLIDGIRERGLEDRINIFVTTDHGFSTLTNEMDPEEAVAASGVDPEQYMVVPDRPKVYVKNSDPEIIRRIAQTLQRDETVGAVFTRAGNPGDPFGAVPGTLSLDSVFYDHDRAPDILFDADWSDRKNEYGFAGHTTQTRYPASHGSASPFDIGIHLVAAGPDIRQGKRSDVPTGNIDLAPTICYLLGVSPADSMEGRVLHELLRDGPESAEVSVAERSITARTRLDDDGSLDYEVTVHRLRVDETEYLHFTETRRHRRDP